MRDILSKTEQPSYNRHYIKSSSFVMAVIFTVLCGLVALSIGFFINYFTTGHFIHSTQAALDAEIRYVESTGDLQLDSEDVIYIPFQKPSDLPDDVQNSTANLSEGILVFDLNETQRRYAAKIHPLDDNQKILIGIDITQISNDFKLMQIIGVVSIVFVMLVVFVAYIISVFVVSNTNKIANTARDIIATGDLSRRLEVGSRWDDLSNMAAVLNQLLDRIQILMRGVRQVSDNIAHDLRTPLTRLHNHIENLENKYGNAEYAELKDETNHILNIFNALLRISRIESEKQKSQFADVNLKNILSDVIDFYEPLATDKNITIDYDLNDFSILGDRDLLFQVYANIVDNAVKFTPSNGVIKITSTGRSVTIMNTGSYVDDEDKGKIFNRFYRTEQSRTTPGTGLGLSLVKAVIDLHDGQITVDNNSEGFCIVTIL